jgi:actin-related protein
MASLVTQSESEHDNGVFFGSAYLLIEQQEEHEQIYAEDLADGIASCAKEQAEVWKLELDESNAAATEEEKTMEERDFDVAMRLLVKACLQEHRKSDRRGAFGTTSRLQPRFKTGAATKFDEKVRQQEALERRIANAKALSADVLSHFKSLLSRGEQEVSYTPCKKMVPGLNLESPVDPLGGCSDDEAKILVIVPQDDMIQAGYGGDDAPRAVFPAIVGRPKHAGVMVGMDQKDAYVGDEAQSKRGILSLKYPICDGVVSNLNDFEKLLHNCFYNELRVDPAECPVLLADAPLTPYTNREQLMRMLFETFNCPAVSMYSSPYLGLLESGMQTGIVVEITASRCTVVPVIDGVVDPAAVVIMPLGKNDIINFMTKILTERGYCFTTTAERDIIRDMTEKTAYAVNDFKTPDVAKEAIYELPDGQTITVGNERFRCIEPLFSPGLLGLDCPSIPESILLSLVRSPTASRKELAGFITLAGQSICPGLGERIEAEVKALVPEDFSVRVLQGPNAKYKAWVGGSCAFPYLHWVTRSEYDDVGPEIVNHKCSAGGYSAAAQAYHKSEMKTTTYEELLRQAAAEANDTALPEETVEKSRASKTEDKQTSSAVHDSIASSNVVASKPLASTNCVVIRSGKIITKFSFAQLAKVTPQPPACGTCQAILINENSRVCPFCRTVIHDRVGSSPTEVMEKTFLLEKPAISGSSTPVFAPSIPMMVFVVDVSGSMGTTTCVQNGLNVPTGLETEETLQHVSRLHLVQAAIRSKLLSLRKHHPETVPVIVSFGSDVRVHFGGGREHNVRAADVTRMGQMEDFLTLGQSFMSNSGCEAAATCVEDLVKKLYQLKVMGCTALGPALALALGISSGHSGSQIIVCTDGEANVGIGSLSQNDSSFYTNVGNTAVDFGISINMVTLENCEAGMESLGTTADISGGSVNVVNPMLLQDQFALLGNSPTVATQVECKFIAGRGLQLSKYAFEVGNTTSTGGDVSIEISGDESLFEAAAALENMDTHDESVPSSFVCPITLQLMRDPVLLSDGLSYERIVIEAWLANNGTSPLTNAPLANKTVIPNVALRQSIEEWVKCNAGNRFFEDGHAKLQIQLTYTLASGEKRLTVLNRNVPLTTSREQAERYTNASVCALHGLQKSAQLSKTGDYLSSRMNLVSFQRLLQRAMRTRCDCESYLAFIMESEPLDQFMREQAMIQVMQSSKLSKIASKDTRDDDASKSIYQSKALTLERFLDRAKSCLTCP